MRVAGASRCEARRRSSRVLSRIARRGVEVKLDKKSLTGICGARASASNRHSKSSSRFRPSPPTRIAKDDIRRCAEAAAQTDPRVRRRSEHHRDRRQSARARPLRRRPNAPTRHGLQPPRRAAGVARDGAVEDRPVRVHEEGRPLLRPRHDRRQGSGADARCGASAPRARPAFRVNMNVLWELEEEIGSPNFEAGDQEAHAMSSPPIRHRLRHDLGLAPAARLSGRTARPAGLRARRCETGETDQHSGVTGGAARNPLGELMKLVTRDVRRDDRQGEDQGLLRRRRCRRRSGSSRTSQTPASRSRQFKKDHLFKSIRTEDPLDVMKRIWAMPTIEIHGVVGGYTGPGIKTVIPPRADGEDLLPPRPESGPAEDPEARQGVREGAQSGREDRSEAAMYPYKAPTDRSARRRGPRAR